MALRAADNFAHWGTGATSRTNMLASTLWTAVGTGFACDNSNPRIPSGWGLKYTSGGNAPATYAVGAGMATGGILMAVYLSSLPASSTSLFAISSAAGTNHLLFRVLANGGVEVEFQGSGTPTITPATAANLFQAGSISHIEVIPTIADSTGGSVDVYINNILVATVSGVDTRNGSTAEFSLIKLIPSATGAFGNVWFYDVAAWSPSGDDPVSRVGNKCFYSVAVDTDHAGAGLDDWALDGSAPAATGFGSVNQNPTDGDVTYLRAATAGDKTELGFETVDPTITGSVAFVIAMTQRLDTSGTSTVQDSWRSGAAYATGEDRQGTYPGWTTVFDFFGEDPDGGGAISPAVVSASRVRLHRTS